MTSGTTGGSADGPASLVEVDGGTVVLSGEFDASNAAALRDGILRAADGDAHGGSVIADLSPMSFIDSSGVRAVLTSALALRERGIELVLVAPPGSPARRILDYVSATDVARVVDQRPPQHG